MNPMLNYSFSYYDLEYFLLVLVRMTCFIYAAPFFSINSVPRMVRVGIGIFLSLIVYRMTPDASVPAYHSILMYSVLVLKEGITGLLIGFSANICTYIVQFAGRIADMEVGLSMVQLMDPMTRESTGFTGTLYQYGVMLIMMVSNLHHFFIRAIIETYTLVPVGMANFHSENMVTTIKQFLTDYVLIAFQLCLPVVASIMILNAVLGILAKSAPQINMFSVGIQIKILVGLTILFLSVGAMPSISDFIFREMKVMVTAMVHSIS